MLVDLGQDNLQELRKAMNEVVKLDIISTSCKLLLNDQTITPSEFMSDANQQIKAFTRAERIKKIKLFLGITIIFLFLVWFSYMIEGGASL